jgi:hypothetical protein
MWIRAVPMTPAQITRDIAEIQARVRAAPVDGSVHITTKWVPTPPFAASPNT